MNSMNQLKNRYQGNQRGKGRNFFTIAHSLFLIPLLLLGSNVYAVQTCKTAITASTPTSQFQLNNNGTVTDTKTTLMWKRCAEGQSWSGTGITCQGGALPYTLQSALTQAQTANTGSGFANFTDWRVPNIKELVSIVEQQCGFPSINSTIFPSSGTNAYWSSSPYVRTTNAWWFVIFKYGRSFVYPKAGTAMVRLVRGGK